MKTNRLIERAETYEALARRLKLSLSERQNRTDKQRREAARLMKMALEAEGTASQLRAAAKALRKR